MELSDGRKISAVDLVKWLYLKAAQQVGHDDEETTWLLGEWERVLDDLENDVALVRDRVDWVAKKFLLTTLRDSENLSWSDPWLQAIDLEYHNILSGQSLFDELLSQGSMRRIVSEDEIKAAIFAPPETTRAYFRGRSVAKFNDAIAAIHWNEIEFVHDARSCVVPLASTSRRCAIGEVECAGSGEEIAFPKFFQALAQ